MAIGGSVTTEPADRRRFSSRCADDRDGLPIIFRAPSGGVCLRTTASDSLWFRNQGHLDRWLDELGREMAPGFTGYQTREDYDDGRAEHHLTAGT